jgi:hypothetical protein
MRLGKVRLALAVVVVAELLVALYLWLPRQRAAVSPGIEERHFITLTVRGAEGRVETRAYETRSVVNPEVLVVRLFSAWYVSCTYSGGVCAYSTRIYLAIPATALTASGYPTLYGYLGPLNDFDTARYPSLVFLGSGSGGGSTPGTLGNPLGVSAVPTVSYVYNDVWFNVTVTATFSFPQDTTVSEAMLAIIHEDTLQGPVYFGIVYDSFPAVSVPAGGSLAVQWVFAWKDYGAFTENWGRLWQYALTLNYGAVGQYVDFTDDTGATVSIPWPNLYSGAMVALRLAWGTGTSPMSRSSYRLQSGAGSAQVGFGIAGTGFSVGAAVGGQASEVGLYWLAVDASGNAHRILLMRWVPGYTLPAGTPVNIYVAKGG